MCVRGCASVCARARPVRQHTAPFTLMSPCAADSLCDYDSSNSHVDDTNNEDSGHVVLFFFCPFGFAAGNVTSDFRKFSHPQIRVAGRRDLRYQNRPEEGAGGSS